MLVENPTISGLMLILIGHHQPGRRLSIFYNCDFFFFGRKQILSLTWFPFRITIFKDLESTIVLEMCKIYLSKKIGGGPANQFVI